MFSLWLSFKTRTDRQLKGIVDIKIGMEESVEQSEKIVPNHMCCDSSSSKLDMYGCCWHFVFHHENKQLKHI